VCAILLALVAAPASAQSDGPHVRFVHLVAGGEPLDIYLDGTRAVEALAFGQASDYLPLIGGSAIATISLTGRTESDNLMSAALGFAAGDTDYHTVALVMDGEMLRAITLPADGVPAATGAAIVDSLSISGAYVRATAAGNSNAMGQADGQMHSDHSSASSGDFTAAYLTMQNDAVTDDRLVAVSADAATRVEVHETIIENDVARMEMLPDGVPILAGSRVELKTGGLHLMLIGLTGPLAPGQVVTLTLTFESGAVAVVRAPVRMP
jgi:hypothetical protein